MVAMDGMLYFDANNPVSQLQQYDPSTGSLNQLTSIAQSTSQGGQIGKFGGIAPSITYSTSTQQINPQGQRFGPMTPPTTATGWSWTSDRAFQGAIQAAPQVWCHWLGRFGSTLMTGLTEMSSGATIQRQGYLKWWQTLIPASKALTRGTFSGLHAINDRWLLFDAQDGTSGYEPWVVDATTGSFSSLGDLNGVILRVYQDSNWVSNRWAAL